MSATDNTMYHCMSSDRVFDDDNVEDGGIWCGRIKAVSSLCAVALRHCVCLNTALAEFNYSTV